MARLSDEERRERAEQKAIRSAAWRARREVAVERRQAREAHRADLAQKRDNGNWKPALLETTTERAVRIDHEKKARQRREALRKSDPGRVFVDQHVTPQARANGDYVRDRVSGPTIIRNGKEQPTTVTVVRNRGGTTIERWQAQGGLTEAQINAVIIYARAWRMHVGEQRVTANWSLVSSDKASASIEEYVASAAQARKTLNHLDDAVFFGLPLHYFETWRNVVIFDEAAGVAGSRLGYRNDRAEAAAKAIVILIADMIATDLRLGLRR